MEFYVHHTQGSQVFAAAVRGAALLPAPVFAQNDPLQQALQEGAQNIEQLSRAIECCEFLVT